MACHPCLLNKKAMETQKRKKEEKPVTVHITNHNQFQKGVGAFITNLNHLTIVMDEDGNMKMDVPQVMPHTQVDVTKVESIKKEPYEESIFKFIHPAIDREEARKIHVEIKNLVMSQGLQEICLYLKNMADKGKILLPINAEKLYNELIRLGMPDGEGFALNTFRNYYKR